LGGLRFETSLGKKFMRPPSQLMAGCGGVCLSSLIIRGSTYRRIMVQVVPGIK
jgi:hypothetical protein